jgi:hypothetical protein
MMPTGDGCGGEPPVLELLVGADPPVTVAAVEPVDPPFAAMVVGPAPQAMHVAAVR